MITPDLIIRTNRKSMSITIDKEGKLIVRAPKRLSVSSIFNFITEKEKWIVSKQNKVILIKNKNSDILNYEAVLFLGKKYNIKFNSVINKIELIKEELLIPAKYNNQTYKNKVFKWFIEQAKTILQIRFDYFVNLMQVDARSLTIMNNKNRWGCCDANANIKLNFRVVMLPHEFVDYIIVHELCHVLQMNHSDEFYKLVECVMPNYKKYKSKLKEYDYLLSLYR